MKEAHQDRSRRRAESLIATGYALIEDIGYENMRISDIARLSGCSVGSFYARFENKETFFHHLLTRAAQAASEEAKRLYNSKAWVGLSATTLIEHYIARTLSWLRNNQGMYFATLILNERGAMNTPVPFRQPYVTVAEHLAVLFAERQLEMANCDDPEAAAWFVTEMTHGTLSMAALSERAKKLGVLPKNDRSILLSDARLEGELVSAAKAYLGLPRAASIS